MKIKKWELLATWDNGEVTELSYYVSEYLNQAINEFMDYFEERSGDNEVDEVEDENADIQS